MSPRRLLVAFAISLMVFASAFAAEACTPAQQSAVARASPELEKDACVLLRALTTSGTVSAICATADMLAPLVPELLAQQQDASSARKAGPPSSARGAPFLAYSLPLPARAVEPRRCVAWQTIAGKSHGSADDAAAPDH